MKPKIKVIIIPVLTIYCLFTSYILLKDYSYANDVVLSVGDKNIKRSEIEDIIISSNWYENLSAYADEVLIDMEGDALGITSSSYEEMELEAKNIEIMEQRKIDLNDPNDNEYVNDKIVIKKLAKKYTIREEELQKFYDENKSDYSSEIFLVKEYVGDHSLIEKMTKDLDEGVKLDTIEGKYDVKFNDAKKNKEELEKMGASFSKVGEYSHFHEGENHGLLYLNGVEEDQNIITSQDPVVLSSYLNERFHYEKVNVLNYLRSKYSVDVKGY